MSESDHILNATTSIEDHGRQLAGLVNQIVSSSDQSTQNLRRIEQRAAELQTAGEGLLEITAQSGIKTLDTPFIDEATRVAKQVSEVLTDAVDNGLLDIEALFDRQYQKIPGSSPEQFQTRYCRTFDELLTPIFDKALSFDSQVVFCMAVDDQGYCATHNSKYSLPQGQDAVWNAANCRNRRFFKDRVGLAAGRNMQPFLVQCYQRDMGGGTFTPTIDVSAPIEIRGRHWGGLRLAYALKERN